MRCYCALSRQVARRLTRVYEAELAPVDMNPAQFELMGNLRGTPGVGQAVLARRMDVDQTTLSRNLKLLMAKGWVSAIAGADDRRRVEYQLSESGGTALDAAMPYWTRATETMRAKLGMDAEAVWKMLERLGSVAGAN